MSGGEEQKADGIGGEVCAEVDNPGEPDGTGALIQAAEDPAAGGETGEGEQLDGEGIPAQGHGHMVEGEGQTAQGEGSGLRQKAAQQQKAEPPEEELLQEGVDQGDVEGDKGEILPVDAGAGGEGGGKAGEVEDSPGEEEAAEYDCEHPGAGEQRQAQALAGAGEERAQGDTSPAAPQEREPQEEQQFDGAFDGIAGLDDTILSPYVMQREVKRTCWIVIAGDRGLAGG